MEKPDNVTYFQKLGDNHPATLTILHKILRNGQWWDLDTARTSFEKSPHSQVSDILFRCCNTDSQTLAEAYTDLEAEDREMLAAVPELKSAALDLMRAVGGTRLGRIVVTKLRPGCQINDHADEGPYAEYYSRYHFVLQGEPGSVFMCGPEAAQMLTGEVWWVNVRQVHSVKNNSKTDRIHAIIDIRNEP